MKKKNRISEKMLRRHACALVLAVTLAFSPTMAAAASPTIPGFYGKLTGFTATTSLPVLLPGGTLTGAIVNSAVGSTLSIDQNAPQATIDWKSFNIAPGSTVLFNQKDTSGKAQRDWAALNRIYDANPSQIFGNLKADGKVYLINRNGILFGPGSQVDVHALIGSALNITLDNFTKGLLRFTTAADSNQSSALGDDVTIANHGTISTDSGGSVSLIGPRVENAGTINAPQGSVNMVGLRRAADGSSLAEGELNLLTSFDPGAANVIYNSLATPGAVVNFSGGNITADSGRVGLYGDTVQQGGMIRAVSAVKKGGEIFLKAKSRVTTDAGSVTESSVSTSSEKVNQTFVYNGGAIQVGGLTSAETYVTGPDGDYVKNEGALQVIEHNGSMAAPSGTINLLATDRIFMGSGSSIDVAGKWVDQSASANMVSSTLNSVELRDSYGQKNGPLKGDKIQSDLLNGSAIGDISGSYGVEEKSALERSTRGGVIALTSGSSGQIIVKDGATLNFSGGGFRYAQGSNQTTMVVAGNRVYDVSSAPQWLNYTLLDSQSKAYSRFGMTESFSGIYYGGGSSVYSSSLGRIAGSDAGTLTLSAGILKLDGAIHGEVTRGIFQTRTTADKTSKEYIANVARGLEAPSGGTLLIGVEPGVSPGGQSLSSDALVQEIVVRPTAVALPAGFGVNDQLPGSLTELSATQLSHAGLSTLSLFSNTNVMIESGARLALARGGSFTAKGRRIENSGEVIVPGGSASFILQDNITAIPKVNGFENPLYTSIISNLFFAPGSLVSVRGETIDNSRMGLTDSGVPGNGILNGGRIAIKDVTVSGSTSGNNLVVAPGATLDVSGGYLIDQSGKVNGGDAGSLELRAMNLSLGGELRGLALAGKKGGEVILHTGDIVVGYSGSTLPANIPPDTVPTEQMKGRLLLSQDRFKETGFTRLSLNAVNDITFSSGIDLTPSMARLPSPLSGNRSSTTTATIPYDNIVYSPDYLGQTSIKAAAGTISSFNSGTQLDGETPIAVNQNSKIVVERGAQLRTAGGGTISLSASAVDIAGSLSAPGGDVSVTARSTGDAKDLNLLEGGRIFAGGYNKPDGKTLAGTSTSYVTQAAGKVSLSGTNVNLNFGSLVDVSGSVPTEQQLRDTGSAPQLISSAGDPGSLTLGFGNKLTLDGSISGRARSFGGRGGTLQISSGSTTKGLEIMAADVALYQASGFDDLNFKSTSSIKLPDVSTLSVGRKLTLDTPILSGSMARDVSITSPWLVLKNTSSIENLNPGQTLDTSGGRLTLTAQALDITGNLQIKDFQEVKLEAGRDITFSDRANATGKGWIGTLWTTGNLTLQAQRIYPTTASQYTLNANGKITILPQDAAPADSASIYSAGGSLSIKAAGGIEQRGLLAAPMGSISLDGMDSRVYLAEGSSTITGGSTPVSYGYFDGTSWSLKGGSSLGGSEVTAAPDKAIAISGREVVVRAGATIDARGGGSITTALWQSGLEGSVNPFTLASRYVILPDNSVILPGRAIYLQGVPELGLKAGVYSILPSDFAFVPGALVIQDTGTRLATGAQTRSAQGYPIVAGYSTVTETAVGSNLYSGYAVRRATEVQKEGNFTIKQFSATDGGKITVSAAETAVIAGSLNGTPLSGGAGALFSLSGANVQVKGTVDALDAGFNFSTPVSTSLIGTMQIQADSVSNKGLKGLKLGDGGTDTVSIEKGSVLQVPDITLTAKTGVTVQSGAQVLGVGDGGSGSVTIQAPLGTLTVEETGLVRAGHDLTLNASDVVLKGEIKADNSALNISAQNIFFVPDVYQHTTAGLYLNKSLWDSFARYTELTLKSNNNMVFQRDVTLAAAGVLTLDAGRFVHQASTADVTIEAKKLSILNSGASQSATEALTGQISLKADTIAISSAFAPGSNQGGVLFDGFGTVKMSSGADLLLQGAGSITTPGALNIAATRLSATSLTTSTGAFLTAPDFKLTSGGAFSYVSATGMPGASGMPGGNLAIQGSSVRISGLIDMPSGTVALTATGSAATDGVFLDSGAAIRAHGAVVQTADSRTTVATPGGRVLLSAAAGPVEIAAGAQVDVAAVSGSDAGSIALAAPNGEVTVKGELRGNPVSGRGGSFAINSLNLDGVSGLDGLSATLKNGGFTEKLNIHSRSGNLALTSGNILSGREVIVAADGGSIDLSGTIDANGVMSGDAGGRVELYAKSALTLESGSVISAKGKDGGVGGSVSLGSAAQDKLAGSYALQVKSGSNIDVAGGTPGSVTFRAYQLNGTDVNMAPLPDGAITGASSVSVEAVKSYSGLTAIGAASVYTADAVAFMGNKDPIKSRLFGSATSPHHLQAGIELVSGPGKDLILDTAWDLTSVRPGNEPGVLTLRSTGNLSINVNLVDHPTALSSLHSSTMQPSWSFNLMAGADLNGASPLAVKKRQGNLLLGPIDGATGRLSVDKNDNASGGALVYTENGAINFSSGNNTDIGYGVPAGYMINETMRYNIGSYGGTVSGATGGDLTIRAGAIQTAVGDIDLRVAGDLKLLNRTDGSFGVALSKNPSSVGSIRTTGEYDKGATTKAGPDFPNNRSALTSDYWTYAGGGSIGVDVGGAVSGQVHNILINQDTVAGNSNAWDTASGGTAGTNKYFTANFVSTDATEGIVTLAGGDLSVRSEKGFTSQVGTFGSGDLTLVSGGDMHGRYRSTNGSGTILAMGNFGSDTDKQVMELGASQLTVVALGDMNVGAVLNPDNTRVGVSLQDAVWDLGYSYKGKQSGAKDSSVSLTSLAGSVMLAGSSTFDGYKTTGNALQRQQILPPVTEIISSGDLTIDGRFALAPSPSGDLRLIAGGNVISTANSSLAMVDVPLDATSPTYVYQRITNKSYADSAMASLFTRTGVNLLHQDDTQVAEIRSGVDGDIRALQLNIDKAVTIQAGRDIKGLVFSGQNLHSTDITSIRAGRDIVYGFSVNTPSTALEVIGAGIKQGGPGALLVEAGRNIDLGNSTGIQSVGGFLNPPLGEVGSSVTVIAGSNQKNMTPGGMAAFFFGVDGKTDHADPAQNGLIKAGDVYSKLKNSGEKDAAAAQLAATRSALIRPLFDEPAVNGDGYITMTSSQINSLGSASDVTILARGSIDVGRSSIGSSAAQGSGISTAGGGKINIYTGKDVNVNESRIMTYLGGDISIWVDQGDLNAGRGSRTSISPSPPRKVYDPATKTFITKFTPPAVGSGIRAVTFDPNTVPGGPLPIPEAGGINIYVPNGKIDAGEAGIVTTSKLTLAATEVINVKNIVGGAGSSGVPVSNENSVSLGSLAGTGNLTDSSKMIETASAGGLSKESAKQKLTQAADDFLSKYLDVKVLGFDTDNISNDTDTEEEREKKKKKK